jgi:hypothetical protein
MLVFVHINKTAGRTMRYILRSSYGARHCEVEPWHAPFEDPPFSTEDLRRVRRIYPKLESIAGHRVAGHVDLDEPETEFRYFTFLRDPLKTTASRFQYQVDYRKKQGLEFEEWIQRDWTRDGQTKRIAGVDDVGEAIRVIERKEIFVGVVERFDESLVMLKALRASDLNISYRRVNVAKRNTLAARLLADEHTRQMLTDANQHDLELYRYVTRELYAGLQSEYGDSLDGVVAEFQRSRGEEFNRLNTALFRLRQHGVYKPLLNLYRRPRTQRSVDKLLARP